MFSNALLALALRAYFAHQNKRLDEAERRLGPVDAGKGTAATELEGTVGYRFVL